MAWMKRLSAPIATGRKGNGKFIVSPRGPHKKSASIPLLVALRDYISLTETLKEGKGAIKRKELLVDGRATRDQKFGVGLMDTISIPSASAFFRIMPRKGGLKFVKISEKESKIKICKIIGKTAVNRGKIQYNLHDGKNLVSDKGYKTKDSLVIGLPELKVVEHMKFEEGSLGLITRGESAGTVAKIEKIENRMNRVWMKKEGGHFEAPLDYVMVVGKEKPAVAMESK